MFQYKPKQRQGKLYSLADSSILEPVERHRVFLAIVPDGKAAGKIAALAEGLKPQLDGFRPAWIPADSYHLTLHFFGEVDPGMLKLLRGELDRLALPVAPHFRAAGPLYLPSPRAARVCALDFLLQPADILPPLIASLRGIAAGLGLPVERRPWHPHLSLARLKKPGPVAAPLRVSQHRTPDICFLPSHAILFESRLSREGARYAELERYGFLRAEKPLY